MALVKHWDAKPKSKRPSSRSYETLKASVNDPLTVAKLQFFSFLAGVLQPFLKSCQTDEPVVPFLYNDIFSLLQQILQTVVNKPDLLMDCKDFGDLMKLDPDKKNTFMKLKYWILGFQPCLQLPSLKKQIRSTMLRFHLFTMVLFNSFQLLQKNFLTKAQCLTMWSEIQ